MARIRSSGVSGTRGSLSFMEDPAHWHAAGRGRDIYTSTCFRPASVNRPRRKRQMQMASGGSAGSGTAPETRISQHMHGPCYGDEMADVILPSQS